MTTSNKETVDNDPFTEESYMNPSRDRAKYVGRDVLIGQKEARRRLALLPRIKHTSEEIASEHHFPPPTLSPKGSAAVNMCTIDSDFDVAVIVSPEHPFFHDRDLWLIYRNGLQSSVKAYTTLELRLVIQNEASDYILIPWMSES